MTRKPAAAAASTDNPPSEPLFARVPVANVIIPEGRLRQADPAKVAAMAHSLGIVGQLQPIRVSESGGKLILDRFGLHRLLAAREVGWSHINAMIVPPGSAPARLDEIFENLIRADLTALERAISLAELKAVHEQLYPSTKKGGDRRSAAAKDQRGDQPAIFAFRSDIAEKIGLSPRSIDLAVAIAAGLGEPIRARLQGSWLADHQSGLKALSEQPAKVQHQLLDILFATPPGANSVADALTIASGKRLPTPSETRFRALSDGLARCSAGDRAKLFALHEVEVLAWAKKRLERAS